MLIHTYTVLLNYQTSHDKNGPDDNYQDPIYHYIHLGIVCINQAKSRIKYRLFT
jgi:hypothetical protein